MHSTLTRSRASSSSRSGVEARVVQQRGGAPQPGRDEHVARRLRPAAGRRAPDEVPGRGVEPVLGLEPLAGQVALAVQDPFGSPAVPLVNVIRHGSSGLELGRRRGLGIEQASSSGTVRTGQSARRRDARPGCARRPTITGPGAARRSRRSSRAAARCTAAPRRRCGSTRPSPAPTRAVADQRHHDVAAADAARASVAGERGRAVRDLAERPLAARAVAGELDQRSRSGGAASTTSRAKFMAARRTMLGGGFWGVCAGGALPGRRGGAARSCRSSTRRSSTSRSIVSPSTSSPR